MEPALQREIVREILELAAADTTRLADEPHVVGVEAFTGLGTFAREQEALFRARPVAVCLTADVREPGDVFGVDSGGVPLVVVRGEDGRVRAFANVCRHRGAALVAPGPGHVARSFRCTFHGWVYDLAGRNIGMPHSTGGFDGLDPACTALVERPAAEAHGFVFVRPVGDAPVDTDALLGPAGPELASFGFGTFHRFDADVREWAANWKLLVDTFLETYHVPALHPTTVGRHFLSRPSTCAALGDNIRFHSLMKTVLGLRDVPEGEWTLLPHGTVEYLLTPNMVVNYSVDHVAIYRFVPLAPDRTRAELTIYTPQPVTTDDDRDHFARTLALHLRVSGGEDFTKQEEVQRGLASGAIDEVVFGRNEPAAILFHRTLDALGARAPRERRVRP